MELRDDCCAPLTETPLNETDAERLAESFKVMADPIRLRLISLIAAETPGVCACDLVTPLGRSQPTISHHLKVLTEAGFLDREKRGRWVWYTLVPERLGQLERVLGDKVVTAR